VTRLLIIQPDASDPLGPLGDWLTDAGAELDLRLLPKDDLPADPDGYQGVVCLGGGMAAEDDAEHPWLADVRRLLAKAATKRIPTLGICLGAQLLAVATGGRVEPGPDGPEVGPHLVAKKDAAWTDPLFADLPLMQDVLQFHTDAITRLPPGAELLASAPLYGNQAFRLGRCAYGVQFHIEFARPGSLEHEALVSVHADIEETWRPFAGRFVRLAAGELEPAVDGHRTLPLA
jgi:GMP synthase-like glutamine amidotransferase